ncbi:MAG: YciI family protein [Proteobacteria bacterium]|nr:YciI family protein [Pseudomonadota bacterium]
MQYAMIISESRDSLADRTNNNQEAYWGAWMAYAQAIGQSGIVRAGAGLQAPETATHIVFKGDKKTVHDGPFPDAKEQLGGFFVIEVETLDQALEWARRCPITKGGSVEVRPVLPPPPHG